MRDASNIQIDDLILHILDPEGQGLVLSGVPLPLQQDPKLCDYFSLHISETFKSPAIKPAQFRNINPEQSSGICRALLRGETTLVEGSQQLAQLLFPILEHDRRITAGDLAVCLFQAENYPYTRFLAIMKIDPSQVFRHVILQDKKGNTYVSFEAEPKAFTNEKLQKCALVQPLEPRHPEYDMLLLDRQVGGAEDDRVARFFSETFLDAKDAYDSYYFTESLYKGLVRAENQVRENLTPEEDQALSEQIYEAVTSRRMNLDRWLSELPVAEPVRDQIDQSLRKQFPVREFNIDQTLSKRLTRKIRYRGDFNLRLEIPSENFYTVIVSEELVRDDPDRGPFFRIVIETDSWKRIP